MKHLQLFVFGKLSKYFYQSKMSSYALNKVLSKDANRQKRNGNFWNKTQNIFLCFYLCKDKKWVKCKKLFRGPR